MPTRNTLDQFIARVVSGAHVEAIEEFYTPNATMQENQSPPRVGRDVLVAHEKAALKSWPGSAGKASRLRRKRSFMTRCSSNRSEGHFGAQMGLQANRYMRKQLLNL